MARPNFLIIGAPKAGTTSLWDLLRQHPQICMSTIKEPRFFSHEEQFAAGWDWYESLFQPTDATRAIGEATPHYSMVNVFPRAVERIAEHLPDVRIIYCVRDPATALPSFWKQLCSYGLTIPGRESMPSRFDEAVKNFPPMIELVRYWHNLEAFRRFIPDHRIHLIFFEDFVREPQATLNGCCQFLGATPFRSSAPTQARNSSIGKTTVPGWVLKWRKSWLWSTGKHLVPNHLRGWIAHIVRRPLPSTIEWTDKLNDFLETRIGPEAARTLEYGGKHAGFWRIAGAEMAATMR